MPQDKPIDLTAKFRALSRSLRASYEAASIGGRHGTDKGLRHEAALADFLRQHLPPKYGVSRGEIVDSRGGLSRQIDLVLYDALHSPLLQDAESSRLFPAECVYATIELKTKLDRNGIFEGVRNVASAKRLDRSAIVEQHGGHRLYGADRRNPPLFGAIFALDSTEPPGIIAKEVLSHHTSLPPEQWTDCVCVLDRALLYQFVRVPDAAGVEQWMPSVMSDKSRLGYFLSGEHTLFLFYLFLLYQLNSRDLFPPELMRYAVYPDIPAPIVVEARAPKLPGDP